MVVLNDVGLFLEILGFALFLFVSIHETYNITQSGKKGKIYEFINGHKKARYGLRYGGIGLIILGLIMQYSFLNNLI